jgi:hypothetical protein
VTNETVAGILMSVWTEYTFPFILPVQPSFSEESQPCGSDLVSMCQTPLKGSSVSVIFQRLRSCPMIATMSTPPVLDAVIWPIAINGGIGRYTIWGICIAIAPLICS